MISERKIDTGKVSVKKHETYEKAMQAAYQESANTAGWTFPVVVFQQASRMLLSGAFPIGFIESRLFSKSASKGSSANIAAGSMNRPEIPAHTRSIAKYLKENLDTKYIMPPLTLNVQESVSLHTIDIESSYKAGYLVIPSGVNLSITDGQHRVKGIVEAMKILAEEGSGALEQFRLDSISVTITCEHDLSQIHQDFADCSKTKALPASLLSLYDTRNVGNRLVFDLEKNCPLFMGRLDTTSTNLSRKSPYLFLANQIRQFVKHVLVRSSVADVDFERRATELIGDQEAYQENLTRCVEYINHITDTIPVLKQIAQLPTSGPERLQIVKYRDEGWICLTATGLNIFGCIGYDLFTNGIKNMKDWKPYVDKFVEIDWRKSGPLWASTIIRDNRILTQNAPLRAAILAVEDSEEKGGIGLSRVIRRPNSEPPAKSAPREVVGNA